MQERGLSDSTEIYLRFHLKDIEHHADFLRGKLAEQGNRSGFCDMVGQPPVSGALIALEAYHIQASNGSIRKSTLPGDGLAVAHGPYETLLMGHSPRDPGTVGAQTLGVFEALARDLEALGGRLSRNTLRTWVYVRDIDNQYEAMVKECFTVMGCKRSDRGQACERAPTPDGLPEESTVERGQGLPSVGWSSWASLRTTARGCCR